VWEALQAVRVSPERTGVVRRRMRQVREERVLRLVLGGLSHWRRCAAGSC
jgi:hypothetical protein